VRYAICILPVLALASAAQLPAQDQGTQDGKAAEYLSDLIHSDLPLYTFEWEELWPLAVREEGSFGCASRVSFGDWHFAPATTNQYADEIWIRAENYGVFHCAAIFYFDDQQSGLEKANSSLGFFVQLGKADLGDQEWELWAIQKGMRPGSEYTLLARQPGGDVVKQFVMLQQDCSEHFLREAGDFDGWPTRYCAINNREDLFDMAARMLRLPHAGTLSIVPSMVSSIVPHNEEGPDTPASGPSNSVNSD
jgi:hypothetical protein